jgi:hypothetical protein
MIQIALRPGLQGGRWARLRSLCGHDEAFIDGAGSIDSVEFLGRLLVDTPGTTVGPRRAKELAVSDCDRLFAAIYLKYFGEQIEGSALCQNCNEPFESSFSLRDLMASMEDAVAATATGPDEGGIYTLPDGRRFRLPTAYDHNSVTGLGTEKATAALLERCVLEGDPMESPEIIQTAMEEVGPVLDLDLEAICPNCGALQSVWFDVQKYLSRALADEKPFLNHEVHLIAMAYGWSHEEILSLTREDRRGFVRLIEADQAGRRRLRA